MGIVFKLLASIVMGSVAAALTGTLASVIATSGYSAVDRPPPNDTFLWAAAIAMVVTLAIGLMAPSAAMAFGRLGALNAFLSILFPLASFATPLIAGHALVQGSTISDAGAEAPAPLAAVLGDIIGAGMFGLTGLVAAVLFLLPALALRRRAEET
jgi:hypothetical protein